jgi:hypothetical protein
MLLSLRYEHDKESDINIHNFPVDKIPECFIKPYENEVWWTFQIGDIRVTLFPQEVAK